jgi:hypothetical protein
MKNRAKCKLCKAVIESFHATDYIVCKCGEIAVDGGDALRCSAQNWDNFMRVDDEGNEIVVKVKDETNVKPLDMPIVKPTRKELIAMLDEMIANIERLPSGAMTAPVTHYDLLSALLLVSEIVKSDLA